MNEELRVAKNAVHYLKSKLKNAESQRVTGEEVCGFLETKLDLEKRG